MCWSWPGELKGNLPREEGRVGDSQACLAYHVHLCVIYNEVTSRLPLPLHPVGNLSFRYWLPFCDGFVRQYQPDLPALCRQTLRVRLLNLRDLGMDFVEFELYFFFWEVGTGDSKQWCQPYRTV